MWTTSLALFWVALVSGEQELDVREKEEGRQAVSLTQLVGGSLWVAAAPGARGGNSSPPLLAPDADRALGVLPKLCPHLD